MKPISDFALELLEQLSHLFSDQQRWDFVISRLHDFGFNALNIGSFSPTSGAFNWSRSSMEQQWLEDYSQDELAQVDPVLAQVTNGVESLYFKCADAVAAADDAKTLALYEGLEAWNYNHLFSLVVPCPGDEARLVLFSSNLPEAEQFMTEQAREMRILATVVATNLGPETDETKLTATDMAPYLASTPPLSRREQQVLGLLAEGLRNDQISEILDIKEITVRTHIRSARDKLGAPTREAALVRSVQMGLIAPEHYRKR